MKKPKINYVFDLRDIQKDDLIQVHNGLVYETHVMTPIILERGYIISRDYDMKLPLFGFYRPTRKITYGK